MASEETHNTLQFAADRSNKRAIRVGKTVTSRGSGPDANMVLVCVTG